MPGSEFDPNYVEHIQHFQWGKQVEKYFKNAKKKYLPIDRFLNYGDLDLLAERSLKDLNANVIRPMISDRLNIYLRPYAAVSNGDFLCFDYEDGFPLALLMT
jgi:hypothetical protein